MSYDDAINALSVDALRFVKDKHILGLGSGRAASAFVKALGRYIKAKNLDVRGVPTSLQIRIVAEQNGVPLIEMDQADRIDAVFDGADQVDSQGYLVKGGGGALLHENIIFSAAKKTIIMTDKTKFVKNINMAIPVEVLPLARNTVAGTIQKMGGAAQTRMLGRGYPFFTQNGNIILDCDFGVLYNPMMLSRRIIRLAGVMEVGIFARPDIIYRAGAGGRFDIIRPTG